MAEDESEGGIVGECGLSGARKGGRGREGREWVRRESHSSLV